MKNTATQLNKDLEGFTKGEWKIEVDRQYGYTFYYLRDTQGAEFGEEAQANARHIEKCVNSHSDLVAALQEARNVLLLCTLIDKTNTSQKAFDLIEATLTKVK